MKHLIRLLFVAALTLGFSWPAAAATCFWVGGTATWTTTNTASWASATGGTAGTCAATGGVPGSTGPDVATFDGNSGGGTVTVNLNANLSNITSSAYTGTLDFTVNTNTFTMSGNPVWLDAGTGTHTVKLGADTFTISCTGGSFGNCWNWSGSGTTLTAGTSTLNFTQTGTCNSGSSSALTFGGKTYATVTITGATCINGIAGSNTFANLTLTGPVSITIPGGTTQTITNAYTWTGTAGNVVSLICISSSTCSISTPAGSGGTWVSLLGPSFTSHSPSFTNCMANNISGASCSAPNVVSGGGGGIIGGGI